MDTNDPKVFATSLVLAERILAELSLYPTSLERATHQGSRRYRQDVAKLAEFLRLATAAPRLKPNLPSNPGHVPLKAVPIDFAKAEGHLTASLAEQVKKFYGLNPYDGPENICRGDGYFAQAFEWQWGMTIAAARGMLGL
jgi:hypothetical protein